MWAFPDCLEWTCPALFLPERTSTSGLSVPAVLPRALLPTLPAPLQSVPLAFSSLPVRLQCLLRLILLLPALLSAPWLLPFLRASLRRLVRPPSFYPAFYRSGRHPSPPAATRTTRFSS